MLKNKSGISIVLLLITSSYATATLAEGYNAIVSKSAHKNEFSTIGAALRSAPDGDTPYIIYIKKGVYTERIVIRRKNITLIGEKRNETIIEADTAAGYFSPQGKKLGTSGSSTVLVNAANFTAKNLTIRNSFDFPANSVKSDNDPTKLKSTQAVALLLAEKSNKARFDKINLEGYQDTLYSKTGSRSYFTDCLITGHVDFIFGSGTTVFDNCEIRARNRTDTKSLYGYITAPSTKSDQPYGLIFINSRLTREVGVPAGSFGLGRPWHPTTQFPDGRYADPNAIGQTVYINCTMEDHIGHWVSMSGKNKQGETIWFQPQDSRFFEYHSKGAGAKIIPERPQLSSQDAKKFRLAAIFPDWKIK
ncbi:pectinesterase family protein [Brenneria uluponensis]|uniref:pectinesterase family protein n=1 Tax=Brenneria uluponensis TaxID=3057057 RepID=UPI0028EF1903|nr:pectinesterase family protein [Brenneria ulupoensis]